MKQKRLYKDLTSTSADLALRDVALTETKMPLMKLRSIEGLDVFVDVSLKVLACREDSVWRVQNLINADEAVTKRTMKILLSSELEDFEGLRQIGRAHV